MSVIRLEFGPLADSLVNQLNGRIERGELYMIQSDHDAIIRCHVRNYLTDCEYKSALGRLKKRIWKLLAK